REAVREQTYFRGREVESQIRAEIIEAAKVAAARYAALEPAREAVKQSLEMYRKLLESSFGMIGPKAQYDALEPLLAIQAINQARVKLLNQKIEYNRAQFRLFTALGNPPMSHQPLIAGQ